jgi:hypothetical protein
LTQLNAPQLAVSIEALKFAVGQLKPASWVNSVSAPTVGRERRYLVRYDAGADQNAWREDEISLEEIHADQKWR